MTDATRGSRALALVVACALLMAQLDGSIIALALPAMARSFRVPAVSLTLCITVYLAAQLVVLPAAGWLAERCGARRVFVAAIAGFTLFSVCCSLPLGLGSLVASRAGQGAAAALMLPTGRLVLVRTTPREDLLRILTITTIPNLLAPTLGPAIGGVVVSVLSWPFIFLLNVPFGIAAFVLSLRLIPPMPGGARVRFDAAGFVAVAGANAALLLALDGLGAPSPRFTVLVPCAGGGLALGVLAIRLLRRRPDPILSLDAVSIATFRAASLTGGLFTRVSTRAIPYVLPLMFQLTMGMSPVRAGFVMLFLNGGDLLLKGAITPVFRRHGFRDVLVVSAVASAAITVATLPFTAATPVLAVVAVLLAMGMVRSFLLSGINALAYADLPADKVGSATILWNMAIQGSSAVGVSLAASVLAWSARLRGDHPGHLLIGDCRAALLAASVAGLLAVPFYRRLPPEAGASLSLHRPV